MIIFTMPMENESKSLNLLLNNQPKDFQAEIRKWWRGKLRLSFILMGGFGLLGIISGYIISLGGNCIGVHP